MPFYKLQSCHVGEINICIVVKYLHCLYGICIFCRKLIAYYDAKLELFRATEFIFKYALQKNHLNNTFRVMFKANY